MFLPNQMNSAHFHLCENTQPKSHRVFWSLDVAALKNRYSVTSSGSATDRMKCFVHIPSEMLFFQYACMCLCVCTL